MSRQPVVRNDYTVLVTVYIGYFKGTDIALEQES